MSGTPLSRCAHGVPLTSDKHGTVFGAVQSRLVFTEELNTPVLRVDQMGSQSFLTCRIPTTCYAQFCVPFSLLLLYCSLSVLRLEKTFNPIFPSFLHSCRSLLRMPRTRLRLKKQP